MSTTVYQLSFISCLHLSVLSVHQVLFFKKLTKHFYLFFNFKLRKNDFQKALELSRDNHVALFTAWIYIYLVVLRQKRLGKFSRASCRSRSIHIIRFSTITSLSGCRCPGKRHLSYRAACFVPAGMQSLNSLLLLL